jgi:hypothetical protein
MDDILYLVHCTPKKDYETWDALKPSEMDIYQYPGVYFSLITKYNYDKEQLYSSKYILIFSKKLLEQQNYHINIYDYNGHINENNTYYPWNLDKLIEKIKSFKSNFMNEVVFHDPIPMKYLCLALINYNISWYAIPKIPFFKSSGIILPQYPLFNDEEPDMTKIPFYCYPYEMNYSGEVNQYPISSKKFYVKMGKMCGVNTNQTKEKIIEAIRKNIPKLYKNRQLLKLNEFKK